jgi:sulfatase modifying factor 1
VFKFFSTYRYLIFALFVLLTSCKTEVEWHNLKGKVSAPWYEPIPYGMTYIKQGAFQLGAGVENLDQPLSAIKNVSVSSFWMDDTEITNGEYRQFVKWTTDSVAASLTFKADLDNYKLTDKSGQIYTPAIIDRRKIDEIWTDENPDIITAIAQLYYQGNERFLQSKEIDYRKVNYRYAIIDLKKAAQKTNSYNYKTQSYEGGIADRSSFIINKEVNIYPDTLVWVRDFTYSYNEPWTLKYFNHEAYNNYPVVGVTWEQANAFCNWRTEQKKLFLAEHKYLPIHSYRLPTEAEWEYAARGGSMQSVYPWGSYYTSTDKGCYLANFKPKRGDYVSDSRNTTKTMKVGSFDPNGYGLYDMSGNVSEWTSTAYDINGYALMHDMNPEFSYDAQPDDPSALKRKVIRGGSWKDVAHFIKVGTREFEYQDSARCFVGFRCVMNSIEDERKNYNDF